MTDRILADLMQLQNGVAKQFRNHEMREKRFNKALQISRQNYVKTLFQHQQFETSRNAYQASKAPTNLEEEGKKRPKVWCLDGGKLTQRHMFSKIHKAPPPPLSPSDSEDEIQTDKASSYFQELSPEKPADVAPSPSTPARLTPRWTARGCSENKDDTHRQKARQNWICNDRDLSDGRQRVWEIAEEDTAKILEGHLVSGAVLSRQKKGQATIAHDLLRRLQKENAICNEGEADFAESPTTPPMPDLPSWPASEQRMYTASNITRRRPQTARVSAGLGPGLAPEDRARRAVQSARGEGSGSGGGGGAGAARASRAWGETEAAPVSDFVKQCQTGTVSVDGNNSEDEDSKPLIPHPPPPRAPVPVARPSTAPSVPRLNFGDRLPIASTRPATAVGSARGSFAYHMLRSDAAVAHSVRRAQATEEEIAQTKRSETQMTALRTMLDERARKTTRSHTPVISYYPAHEVTAPKTARPRTARAPSRAFVHSRAQSARSVQ